MEEHGIDQILSRYKRNQRDALIPILQEVQESRGYIPEPAVREISRHLNIPASQIFGTASFYDQFRFDAPGRIHIIVCAGTSCHLEQAGQLLEKIEEYLNISAGQTSRDGIYSLSTTSCLGACGLAPVISVNGDYHDQMTIDAFKTLIKTYSQQLT